MEYKTELHCHSKDASGCASESAEGIVEKYLKYGYSELEFHKEITGTYSLVLVFESSDEIKDIFEKYAPDYVISRVPKNYEKTVLLNKENITYHLTGFYLACVDHFKDNTVMKFECRHVYAFRNI